MKTKSYSYSHGDVIEFKKYILWLVVCVLMASFIGSVQGFLLINATKKEIALSTGELFAGYGCLFMVFVFVIFMIIQIIRNASIIKKIKSNGLVEIRSIPFNYNSKFSFGNIVRFFNYVVLTICSIFVVAFATYGVYNYLYYYTINYYVPISLMIFVSVFYSTKMLENKYNLEKQE